MRTIFALALVAAASAAAVAETREPRGIPYFPIQVEANRAVAAAVAAKKAGTGTTAEVRAAYDHLDAVKSSLDQAIFGNANVPFSRR